MPRKRTAFDIWERKYKPIKNHLVEEAPFDGYMFETYGKEVNYVRKKMREKSKYFIWTLIDCEGKSYIECGAHFVNRLGYFITEIPYTKKQYDSGLVILV